MFARPEVVVVNQLPEFDEAARRLADSLGLAWRADMPREAGVFCLHLGPERLELRLPGGAERGAVCAEFVKGASGYRRRHGGGRKQPLARACGLKPGHSPEILDATAGLGRDAFVLACLGCRVRLIERSPLVAALLQDGLRRAAAHPETAELIGRRLNEVTVGEAVPLMRTRGPTRRPEVIYLDPMYPPRRKSALVKKEMRLLRLLLGEDQDAAALLPAALELAERRVVVKRPAGAPVLAELMPDLSIEAPNTRFDVYLAQSHP